MTNKDEETRMLSELANKPVRWVTARPAKVKRLVDWQFELPMWYWQREIVMKYLRVLRAAGLEHCEYCGKWRDASQVVRVPMHAWNPSSSPMLCCESTCEIELLRSR